MVKTPGLEITQSWFNPDYPLKLKKHGDLLHHGKSVCLSLPPWKQWETKDQPLL